jgi:hypothetical protein
MEVAMIRLPEMLLIGVAIATVASTASAQATQSETKIEHSNPDTPNLQSKWWIVGGGGFSMARAGCATCGRSGVFKNTVGLFLDVGGRVGPRADVGVEVMFVRLRVEHEKSILTTFILGLGQFRPWKDKGLYLRAGMGVGFAGHGLYSPFGPKLAPPYSTNALGIAYGIGWIFRPERRVTLQANFSHHIAALGELSTVSGETVQNVVGNYWTSGMAVVIR